MSRSLLCSAILLTLSAVAPADSLLVENFNDVPSLAGAGWALINNSAPLGTAGWFQGNPAAFGAQSGAPNSYIAANFLNADAGGDVSNWLLTPVLQLVDGEIISFYTRTVPDASFPDRLELRLSTNGASTNVGGSAKSVGDFGRLLLTINPALAVGGYPEAWSSFSGTVSGLGAPATGRFAFHYVVPNTEVNGDYIGIDTVSVSAVPEPATIVALCFMLAATLLRRRARWIAIAAIVAFGVSGFGADSGKPAPKPPRTQAAKAAKPAAHPAAAGGVRVFIDPATGKIREPEPGEVQPLAPLGAQAMRAGPADAQTLQVNGLSGMRLDDSQLIYSVATRNPDGTISVECVKGAANAGKAVSRNSAPREKSNEK
ncbi:MAG: choice-of-anchor J domain-containing protein [Acidobacteriia bacterium]|nr:choice-of-anchor J domain-containing protein [Terriglobia bacterium]